MASSNELDVVWYTTLEPTYSILEMSYFLNILFLMLRGSREQGLQGLGGELICERQLPPRGRHVAFFSCCQRRLGYLSYSEAIIHYGPNIGYALSLDWRPRTYVVI